MNSLRVTANSQNCLQKEKKKTLPVISLFQTATNDSSKKHDCQELTFVIANAKKNARWTEFRTSELFLTNLFLSQ